MQISLTLTNPNDIFFSCQEVQQVKQINECLALMTSQESLEHLKKMTSRLTLMDFSAPVTWDKLILKNDIDALFIKELRIFLMLKSASS